MIDSISPEVIVNNLNFFSVLRNIYSIISCKESNISLSLSQSICCFFNFFTLTDKDPGDSPLIG